MELAELRERISALDASKHEALQQKLWFRYRLLIKQSQSGSNRKVRADRKERMAVVIPLPLPPIQHSDDQ
jgi:hypothetical protein